MMNPIDAKSRSLKTGDMVEVFNDRGRVQLPVHVTPRIFPGVVAFPQGGWYTPGRQGRGQRPVHQYADLP